jgi:hypothetical protein
MTLDGLVTADTSSQGSAGQSSTVHVIVTCANRKSRPIPAALQLGNVSGSTPSQRAMRWIRRLAQPAAACTVAALDLYAGEHWSIARGFPALRRPGESIRLWACSAGYGLIPAEALLMPYHATLTRGQADSVPGDPAAWWSMLSGWQGQIAEYPRSIQALVAAEPSAVFMFVLSKSYLRACGADIAAAAGYANDLDRLLIVSAGARAEGELSPFMVPADARLQGFLGGTRRALNARIAAHIISAGLRNKKETIGYMTDLLAEQPPIPVYGRKKLSDTEIRDLISQRLVQVPGAPTSRLLREFRDAGLACEQKRFGQLYSTVAVARP